MTLPIKPFDKSHAALLKERKPHKNPSGCTALAQVIEYQFSDNTLLDSALTHPSFAGMQKPSGGGYERLEFLGDRVLGLVIAQWLFERYPNEREGNLTKRMSALVRRETLSKVAMDLHLGDYLYLSPGEIEGGGRKNPAILADACEAVIGALYLDGGLTVVRHFIQRYWGQFFDPSLPYLHDSKTLLQEWVQEHSKTLPIYRVIKQTGPAHSPYFEVEVSMMNHQPVQGYGRSRRAAEKHAAQEMLRCLKVPIDE